MTISVVHTTSANSLSVTIPSTTAGNCLVVAIMSENSSAQSVSGITLGGSADNFAAAVSDTTQHTTAFIWCDPNCAGGQTAIVISGSNLAVGTGQGGVVIYEVSGLATSSVVDKTSHSDGTTGTSWTSTATATTTVANEFWVGCADTTTTPTGPSSPWSNTAPSGGHAIAGYQIVASTGTATYNGTAAPLGGPWAACTATLAAGGTSANVTGVAAHVTVQGGIGTPAGGSGAGNVNGVAAHVTVQGGIGTPAGGGIEVVNQWAGTFAQPSSFGSMPPALQSTVIALDSGTSVGGGTGTPTAGNWLFCLSGWNQNGLAPVATGDADDIHSFWRPAVVSQKLSASTRASIWYTPNLARTAADVYAAPNGCVAGMSVLVVEVAGLGPWDTVTGTGSSYAAAGTSVSLTLPALGVASFVIATVCGDNDSASQAFAPGGWSTLHTVTATNGSDHTCDAVLTSAFLPDTSGSVSVSGTAGSATDLSAAILAVQVAAASPITGTGITPAWPGRMILEAGFGSGFETPPDEISWTTLSDSGIAPSAQTKRFWGWADQSGVPYTLGQLQSSSGTVQLDNADGALTPSNAASPWYPDVTTGTPVRLRAALGTIGGTTVNRWYTFTRNALEWPEKRNDAWRNYVELATTDIWSVVAGTCPTPYRGEILQDNPYSWYAMDDQPLAGGVQPTTLRNSAPGNSNVMTIYAASGGVSSGDQYSTAGTDLTTHDSLANSPPPPSIAVYSVGQQAGWQYGDPQSSPASYATGNPVTSSPGSAAWQQTGLLGSGGSNGWYMAVNDAGLPPLASGMTFTLWFNAAFFGTANGYKEVASPSSYTCLTGQPYSQITLATLATASAPVAIIYLDLSGHLILETFNGGSGTTHSIYSSSDLRSASWHSVTLVCTSASNWTCYVDGGQTAVTSGTGAGMTSAWDWQIIGADCGSGGGTSLASATHMGNVAYSHAITFPAAMPAWRVLAHYCAAATGFGVIPAPQTVSLTAVANQHGTGYVPDGSAYQGSYGVSGLSQVIYSWSGLVAATIGSYTSGPSARSTICGYGTDTGGTYYGPAVWIGWTGLAPGFTVYTAANADAETSAATVNGSGDAFTTGFGSGATGVGVCQTGTGGGASPPSEPSALGDDVGQRLERVLGYARVTLPNRAIDPAPLAVQAALDVGGQQCGGNLNNLAQSDNGLLFVDNNGTLSYRDRSHLNSDTVVWHLSSAGPADGYPFKPDQIFENDPQRVYNVIQVQPYSPDGATLPALTPSDATAADASQTQYGPRPLQITSYLQSATSQQSQADWLLSTFGALERRVSSLTVDAAGYPAAWLLVLGANVGDLVQVVDQPMLGGPQSTGTYRISSISRKIAFGANQSKPEASITIVADPDVTYWS